MMMMMIVLTIVVFMMMMMIVLTGIFLHFSFSQFLSNHYVCCRGTVKVQVYLDMQTVLLPDDYKVENLCGKINEALKYYKANFEIDRITI